MTAEQISSMVLSNYNRKLWIEKSVDENVNACNESILRRKPGFILQAHPTVELTERWQVHDDPRFAKIILGNNRITFHPDCSLTANEAAPGLDCIRSFDYHKSQDELGSYCEIRTNGILVVVCTAQKYGPSEFQFPTFSPWKNQLFCAFGHMLDETLSIGGVTSPYLISCSYVNTRRTMLYLGDKHIAGSYSESRFPLDDPMRWVDVFIPAGDSAEVRCSQMGRSFYHSFGFNAPDRLPTKKSEEFDEDSFQLY